jgi:UTP-glucose-1-phosphate uridylyltransferase
MNKPSLLVLAAGAGSRYGGLKQIDPVGPNGETIIDYSVFDALRAGFGKLVFVIRRDFEAAFKEAVGSRFERRLPVEYVFQELGKLPPGASFSSTRKKPWGTGHAVLMGAEAIAEPFGVINGDDFYGARSFQALGRQLQSGSSDFAMVGFVLRNTLSEFGSVARGVCQTTPDGFLQSVVELTRISTDGASIQHTDEAGRAHPLQGTETVSLNMWGFTPAIFPYLNQQMTLFLQTRGQDDQAEFFIPSVVNTLIESKAARVKVLHTPDSWFGITYRQDRPRVIANIRRLITQGEYPEKLWGDLQGALPSSTTVPQAQHP